MAASLVKVKEIIAVVIKEISINMPKEMIITAVSEFGNIKSIKIQLIGMWQKAVVKFAELKQAKQLASRWSFFIEKDLVHMTMTMFRDCFRVLLFTLLVRTTAHNLGTFLKEIRGKTCVINCYLETGNRTCCTITRLDLVWCERCKKFRHLALKCDASDILVFASPKKSFKKNASDKSVLISYLAAFGGKTWAQVVSFTGSFGGFYFSFGSGSGLSFFGTSDLNSNSPLALVNNSFLNFHLVSLECSLELLADQMSGILKKLSCIEMVPMALPSGVPFLATSIPLVSHLNVDMALNNVKLASVSPLSAIDDVVHNSSSSFSKVLIFKFSIRKIGSSVFWFRFFSSSFISISGLVWKVAMCNHKNMGNVISVVTETKLKSKSGYLGLDITIIMNVSLAKHVYKVFEVSGRLISVKLLFKNKFLVMVLGLYVGATLKKKLTYLYVINLMVAETLNDSTFVVLGGNFNKNNSGHSFGDALLVAVSKTADDFEYHKAKSDINRIDGRLVKTAVFFRFHKLKLLVAKILIDLDFDQAVKFKSFLDDGHGKMLHIEAFANNKGQIIKSVLEKFFRKVMLDYLIDNRDLVLEPDLVKNKVDSIIKNWTRKHTVKSSVSSHWQGQFSLLNYVNNGAFSGMIKQIDFNEFLSVVKNLPDGKAAVCSTHNVLRGDNFSVLKGTSIQSPIFVIEFVVEDALKKGRELWLVLQNMRKAYDSVGWLHLKSSLERIKMCKKFVKFFGSIHNGHTNRVMIDFGLFKNYKVHDGLD
ncbi:hypothetical protein G9A89_021334 [Geosiphon pyriformis]|nr:hypothetical protein G9A89_021334 [Geosiphon pyriformis]